MEYTSLNPLISVIIPTFNRADLLSRSLESLTRQTLPKDHFEVVVIDDGSSDHTRDVCNTFENKLHLKYQYQKNSGISAAKNMGVFISKAELLLFFDDDDVADAELLKEHIKTHSIHTEETVAVLGYTSWHPSLALTHVMNYVTNIGHFLFSYSNLKNGQTLDFTYFWGGRSSCKKSLLVKHGIFNQLFRFGSEDIELGYRLSKFGLKVIYNARAKSFMIRPLNYDEFCRRCLKQGKSQYHFAKMHSDPVIQNYCMINKADEIWTFVNKSLDDKIKRVKDLEQMLQDIRANSERKKVFDELEKLYHWTFTALKIRGIVEAKGEDKDIPSEDRFQPPTAKVSNADIELLQKAWANNISEPFHRGNVLIIDPLLPVFDRASGSLRLFEIMKALIRIGFRLTYIARSNDYADVYIPILQKMGVEVYAGDPFALQKFWPDIIAPYLDVEKILRSKSFDYVILSFWHIAEHYLPIVREFSPGSHIIMDTVDIHFLREFREAEMKGGNNLLAAAEENKKRELTVYGKAERLWVVTEEDRKVIKDIVKVPIDIIPNIHKKVDLSKVYELTSNLLFVGNFNHKPNIDAVLFFHDKIFPLIRKRLPSIKAYIVGNNPPPQIKRLHNDHFIITGYVKVLSPYLRESRISVSPLTYGAGMKGKIGEALSWGLPVVTTTIGAEGMYLEDNKNAMIADDPKEFADKVIELYNDREKWEKLSANGKKLIEERWSPNTIQKLIDSSLLNTKKYHTGNVSMIFTAQDNNNLVNFSDLHSILNFPGETLIINHGSPSSLNHSNLKNNGQDYRDVHVITERPGTPAVRLWNNALSRCKGDLIILLNMTGPVDIQLLSSMVSSTLEHPDIDVMLPFKPIIPTSVRARTENAGNTDCLDDNLSISRISLSGLKPLPFFIMRSSVMNKIGGLDLEYMEEQPAWYDFLTRASLTGCRVTVTGDTDISYYENPFEINYVDFLKKDWDLFAEKWGTTDHNNIQLNSTGTSHIGKSDDALDYFCSLGESDHGESFKGAEKEDKISHVQHIDVRRLSGLTSIIILCLNQIEYTKQCLDSIEKYTTVPYELIIVDNGSSDGTPAFLVEYEKNHSQCRIILNNDNRGFAGGNNQGIAEAKGEYILLLNNDVVVTQNWLERLIDHIESDVNIGMAGPVSNSVSGPQQVENVLYGTDMNRMHQYANDYSHENVGRTQNIMRLAGFCLLIKRQVVDIIGGLDDNYGNGNYEDDDLCLRSFIAGYYNIIAHDVFIHHYGSMTFKGNAMNYDAALKSNRQYFAEKWQEIVSVKGSEYAFYLPREKQLDMLIGWGEDAFSKGNIRSAIKIFERVLRLDKRNSQALSNLGVIQCQLGDPVSAISMFQRALACNPKDSDALANLKETVSETGRFDLIDAELLSTIKRVQPENDLINNLINLRPKPLSANQ